MIVAILALALLVCSSHSFPILYDSYNVKVVLSSSVSSHNNVPSDDTIRKDIEAMRQEAKERLELLRLQMTDIIKKHESESSFPKSKSFEEADPPLLTNALDSIATRQPLIEVKNRNTHTAAATGKALVQQIDPPRYFIDSSLLHGTRWKVAIQIGSPSPAAAVAESSERALLLHLVVDFTPELLLLGDEMLQGTGARVLEVKEAWVGASSLTEGRQRPVPIASRGGWKVLTGQGPKGIDILRFYVDFEEEICHDKASSTLRCPAKRVYCTSGFFPMGCHNEAEAFKNHLRDELGRLVDQHEDLTLEGDRVKRLFSFDALKRARKLTKLRQEIKRINEKITQARIRHPEKAMLRLSRGGDVGLTREGQVCYKDDTNAQSSDYLVLGKMEMASINKPIVETIGDPNRTCP